MGEKKNVPEIRFRGFDGEWEKRRFSDITFLSGEKNKDNLPYKSYSITNENGFVPQDVKFENGGSMRDADKKMYYIVSPNSFAYNPARINVGSIGYQNLQEDVIVSSLYEVFKTTNSIDDAFLWHWFTSDDFKRLIWQLQEGGVRLYFYYDKLCMGSISLPSVAEQSKISTFLSNLDNLITLHQRKYDKLVTVKKSMLDKMFPKDGADVPEIRFAGFMGKWKWSKWVETVDISTNMVDPKIGIYDDLPHIGPGNIEPFTGRLLDNVNTVKEDKLISGKFHFYPNDIVYGKIRPVLKKYYMPDFEGLASADAYILKAKNGLRQVFLYTLLQTQHFFNYSVSVSMRSGMPKINREELNDYSFLLPKESDEQTAIGNFFRNLDNLITAQSKQLDKLKTIKQSMLDKLFV